MLRSLLKSLAKVQPRAEDDDTRVITYSETRSKMGRMDYAARR